VPQLGTRNTLLSIGIIALLLGLAWARRKSPRDLAAMATMCLIAGALVFFSHSAHRVPEELVAFSEDAPSGAPVHTLVESSESPYQAIEVWDEQFKKETRRALLLNGTLQFSWNRYQPLTEGRRYEFYNYMTAAALWGKNAPAKRVLILGLGGGLIHWQMEQFFPKVEIVTYELDPGMAEIAKRLLPLSATNRTETLVGDGRILLQQDGSKYDLIVLDTYLNSYVPFHLTTREFFALAARHLNPGGILLANFHSIFSSSGLLPKLEATISSVFPTVSAVPLAAGITLVIASSTPARLKEQIAANAAGFPPDLQRLTREAAANLREAAAADEGVELLTDDRNDTEQRLYDTRKLIGELPSPLTSNL
jgi:spermidine synthase